MDTSKSLDTMLLGINALQQDLLDISPLASRFSIWKELERYRSKVEKWRQAVAVIESESR